jgi:hypothetical protein
VTVTKDTALLSSGATRELDAALGVGATGKGGYT